MLDGLLRWLGQRRTRRLPSRYRLLSRRPSGQAVGDCRYLSHSLGLTLQRNCRVRMSAIPDCRFWTPPIREFCDEMLFAMVPLLAFGVLCASAVLHRFASIQLTLTVPFARHAP